MGKRIVVATNEPFFFGAGTDALQESGFDVQVITDAPTFLTVLRNGEGDLAIVVAGPLADWDIVEKAGLVTTQEGQTAGFAVVDLVRQEGNQVPAIFLSTAYHYHFLTNTTVVDWSDVSPPPLVGMV